jgi:glutaredoxin 2
MQQYEAEVRNHIKVQQQLKLHIEVLNERIEEFEKEKEEIYKNAKNEFKETEKKMKEKFQSLLDQKQSEIARINRDMQVLQAQLKQQQQQN